MEYSGKYWFINLNDKDKKYITDHPDPSHLVYYLKKGLSFNDAIRLGYEDAMREDNELESNTSIAISNKILNSNQGTTNLLF